ncbi:DUF1643 domain-containing protein [Rugamonas sp. FT81W]|uniref:DUF1643 domain-containing protein n=2 Tax=Duganella vulcania TaxID=2692166 RepID=A0A845GG04_9BURK|nr:DUF1643 domain-containing protein [Duganella vulcania]
MAGGEQVIRREHKTLTGSTGAVYSACETYRYLLWRIWDESLPPALLLLMNPSTADETSNDPTVERQIRRVRMWPQIGFPVEVGGLVVANVFAYRETESEKLAGLHQSGFDLVGPENDAMIVAAAKRAAVVVCGWGKPGALGGRDRAVLELLRNEGIKPFALNQNQDSTPTHPLFVGYAAKPFEMSLQSSS